MNGKESLLRPSLVLLGLFTLLMGIVYPLAVWGIAQIAFPNKANGSLIEADGRIVGSELIAQEFTGSEWFWPRPSAVGYNAAASGGSNLAPTNLALVQNVEARIAALRAADPENNDSVPVDLVTASASGLDPDISPASAYYQAARVARARGLNLTVVERLIDRNTEGRKFGILGEPRVNVLQLNRALVAEKEGAP